MRSRVRLPCLRSQSRTARRRSDQRARPTSASSARKVPSTQSSHAPCGSAQAIGAPFTDRRKLVAVALAGSRGYPVKCVAQTLGVARSNLLVQSQSSSGRTGSVPTSPAIASSPGTPDAAHAGGGDCAAAGIVAQVRHPVRPDILAARSELLRLEERLARHGADARSLAEVLGVGAGDVRVRDHPE